MQTSSDLFLLNDYHFHFYHEIIFFVLDMAIPRLFYALSNAPIGHNNFFVSLSGCVQVLKKTFRLVFLFLELNQISSCTIIFQSTDDRKVEVFWRTQRKS